MPYPMAATIRGTQRQAVAAASNWWAVAGKTCVAAYQPIGAASLAASYTNLANPGTYDAAPGTAPTFAAATGWTFDGSTQYLTTGNIISGTGARTIAVRMTPSNNIANKGIVSLSANATTGSTEAWDFTPELAVRIAGGNKICEIASTSDMVVIASGPAATTCANISIYKDGSLVTQTGVSDTAYDTGTGQTYIGRGAPGGAALFYTGIVSAISIYSGALDASEQAALTTRMAAL